ncbi:hypothetical protein AVEN_218040-1 [Araneus ventricosus]|uniref:Uncharacterized protein n=1 Tax=Araneus ventricosus TaxID=182803 RepID=A0A4Y2S717_ARAVE|nr:hypothetical protein AVEN_218040-1 [Araneus ventricosus]
MFTDFPLLSAQGQTEVIRTIAFACTEDCFQYACGADNGFFSKVNYTDRQPVNPLTDLAQNLIRTYIHDDETVCQILSIQLFKFLSYSARMTADGQTGRLPLDGFRPKFDRTLQIMCKDHIPNFIPVAQIVFELSCS